LVDTKGITQVNTDMIFNNIRGNTQIADKLKSVGITEDNYDPWNPNHIAAVTLALLKSNVGPINRASKINTEKLGYDPGLSDAALTYYQWNQPSLLIKGEAKGESEKVKKFQENYNLIDIGDFLRKDSEGNLTTNLPEILIERKKGDGSWVNDSSIPVPTSPSYYPAGADRTLSNYQMGTPEARMYNAGSTVYTNQDTAYWVNGGAEKGTQDKRYPSRNTRSLDPSYYTIGDVVPIPNILHAFDPSAGTHDYNQDVQPYPTTRLHAPDTTMMGDGSYVNRFNTKLKGKELEAFNYHSNLFKNLLNDTGDYDTKGFYQEVYNKYNGDLDAITQALTPGSPTQHIGTDRFKNLIILLFLMNLNIVFL
jgi:hypothetical protein